MPQEPETTVFEIEINLHWAQLNPEEFFDKVNKFIDGFPEQGWSRSVDTQHLGVMRLRMERTEGLVPKEYSLSEVRVLAERYLRCSSSLLPHRKRMMELVLADLGLKRVSDAVKSEDRRRIVDLVNPAWGTARTIPR